MIRLEPMAEALIHEFVQSTIESFAQDQVRVGNWARSEVVQKGEALLGELLPDGPSTDGPAIRSAGSGLASETAGRERSALCATLSSMSRTGVEGMAKRRCSAWSREPRRWTWV